MIDKFMAKVFPEPNSGCWLWTGCVNSGGYGIFISNNRRMGAHRASYEIHYGEIKPSLFVCHKCDVKACVNPNHLFLGTPKDNTRDYYAKKHALEKAMGIEQRKTIKDTSFNYLKSLPDAEIWESEYLSVVVVSRRDDEVIIKKPYGIPMVTTQKMLSEQFRLIRKHRDIRKELLE